MITFQNNLNKRRKRKFEEIFKKTIFILNSIVIPLTLEDKNYPRIFLLLPLRQILPKSMLRRKVLYKKKQTLEERA